MGSTDVMVTARMSPEKKERGNRCLQELGTNASQVINRLYDFIIETGELPFAEAAPKPTVFTAEAIAEARRALAELKLLPADNPFATMTDEEIRANRLRSRGLMERDAR